MKNHLWWEQDWQVHRVRQGLQERRVLQEHLQGLGLLARTVQLPLQCF